MNFFFFSIVNFFLLSRLKENFIYKIIFIFNRNIKNLIFILDEKIQLNFLRY
jgi:hypothetical protein